MTDDAKVDDGGGGSETPRPSQHARAVILAACALILVVAAFYRGHSVESMDVRTYVQMMRGVAEHGLPYWNNGPIDRFQALVVQWGIPVDGHVWGVYSPLYPYLTAPIFRLGGIELVSRFTFAMLAPLVAITFVLARRFVQNEWYAVLAGILVVISTPITAKALELTPFPLITLLATIGAYFGVRAIEEPRPSTTSTTTSSSPPRAHQLAYAFGCGSVWAAATAAHVLCFPMALAVIPVVALAPSVSTKTRVRTTRALVLGAGFIVTMLPVALLNRIRFGSFNPISYGPVPWTGLSNSDHVKMNALDQARYAAPLIVLIVLLTLAIVMVVRRAQQRGARERQRPPGRASSAVQQQRSSLATSIGLILAIGLVTIVITPTLRERFARFALIGCGYIVDLTIVDMGPAYPLAQTKGDAVGDGISLGRMFAGWNVKSTLQCTPLLALAPLTLVRRLRRSSSSSSSSSSSVWPFLVLLIPCVALFGSLISRANLSDTADAMGWPWVYIRYTFPALPALLVLSMVIVERISIGKVEVGVATVVAAIGAVVLIVTTNDEQLWRRVLTLAAPLLLAAASVIVVLREKTMVATTHPTTGAKTRTGTGAVRSFRLPGVVLALTLGLGAAIGLGHDLRANIDAKKGIDGLVNRVNAIVPQRFALVGVLGDFDPALSTAATHDVQYADLLRLDRYEDLHPLLEHWRSEGRPIYFYGRVVRDELPWSPWPNVRFERVSSRSDSFEMFLVHFTDAKAD